MKEKIKKHWIAIFYVLWVVPLMIGGIAIILKLLNVLNFSWLLILSPILFSYAVFFVAMMYVCFKEKVKRIFK